MIHKRMFKCGVFLAAFFICIKTPMSSFALCTDDGAGNIVCDNNSAAPYYQTSALSGDTLSKTGAGSVIIQGGATINNNLNIEEGALIFDAPNTPAGNFELGLKGILQASGDIDLSNNTVTDNGTFNVNGQDSTLAISGSLNGAVLNKEGAGVLALNTSNAYSGALNVNEGDVSASSASFQGAAVLAQESSLLFEQNSDGVFSGSVSGGTLIKSGGGALVLNGQNSADTIISAGSVDISSAQSLQGGLTLDGGSLTVSGNLTLGISAQDIIIAGSSQTEGFDISSGNTLTFGENINLSGGGAFVKNGAGSLILGGDASSFTGGVYINEGVLSAADGNLLGVGSAPLVLGGGVLAFTETTALGRNIDIAAAGSALNIADGKTLTLNAAVTGAQTLVKTGDGELKFTAASQNTGGVQVDGGILSGTGASLSGNIANHAQVKFDQDADGLFTGSITGNGILVKNGVGNLTLQGTIISGGISLNAGALTGDSLSLASDIAMGGGVSLTFKQQSSGVYNGVISGAGILGVEGSSALFIASDNTFSGETIIKNGGTLAVAKAAALGNSSLTISGGTFMAADNFTLNGLALGTGVNYISVADGKTFTSGSLSGTSFVKTGGGDLYLNTANTHSGGTQVSGGGIIIDSEDALGGGIFALTGGALKNNANLVLERNIYLDGATSAFDVQAGTDITLNGILYGDGTLNKNGAGTLVLTAANIFTGGINITAGTLEGDTRSIRGDINMGGASTLNFKQDFNGYFDRNIVTSSADTVIKSGAGALLMQGNNTIGTLNAQEGLLIYNGNLNGNTIVGAGAAFIAAGTFNGDITAAGSFSVQENEALNITGALNIQSGATADFTVREGQSDTISAGSLNIQSGAALDIYANGIFAAPQSFDLLSAGIINGVFDDVTVANNRRLSATAFYDGGILKVAITRLLSDFRTNGAQNTAQRAFAAAVDRASAAPDTDFETFLNTVEDSSNKAALLNQSGGFIYANAFNSTAFDSVVNNTYMRLYKQPDSRNTIQDNIWFESINYYGRTGENENSAEMTSLTNGVNIGLDSYYNDSFNLGYFAAYARHTLKHNKTEKAEGDEYMLGAYLTSIGALWDFKGVFALVYNDINFERDLSFLNRSAKSRGKAYGLNLDIEQGVNFGKIRPFAALRGRYINRQNITENGADSLNLKFNNDNVFAAYARVGIGFAQYGKIDFYGDIALRRVLYEPSSNLTVFGQDYEIEAADVKTFGEVNLGLQKRFSELLSLYAGAGFKFAAKAAQGNFNIGIRSYF